MYLKGSTGPASASAGDSLGFSSVFSVSVTVDWSRITTAGSVAGWGGPGDWKGDCLPGGGGSLAAPGCEAGGSVPGCGTDCADSTVT